MGLFDTDTNQTKAQTVADQVLKSADNQARMISQTYKLNYNKIWRNPDPDVKPEDVVAAFKTNAVKLFTVTNQSMALSDPDGLMALPDGYTWQPQADGSIAITYTKPPDPVPPEPTTTTPAETTTTTPADTTTTAPGNTTTTTPEPTTTTPADTTTTTPQGTTTTPPAETTTTTPANTTNGQ